MENLSHKKRDLIITQTRPPAPRTCRRLRRRRSSSSCCGTWGPLATRRRRRRHSRNCCRRRPSWAAWRPAGSTPPRRRRGSSSCSSCPASLLWRWRTLAAFCNEMGMEEIKYGGVVCTLQLPQYWVDATGSMHQSNQFGEFVCDKALLPSNSNARKFFYKTPPN